jgi:hypothetical protein
MIRIAITPAAYAAIAADRRRLHYHKSARSR